MIALIKKNTVSYLLLTLLLLLGCKTVMAPEYDKAIVESVTVNSEKTMVFLASISAGTTNEDFEKREEKYNELIGAFDALKLQAKARPIPNNVPTKKINELLAIKNSNALSGDYPSAFAFEQIANTFQKMKEVDEMNGIKPTAMLAFRGMIETYLDQAITYESFLKR